MIFLEFTFFSLFISGTLFPAGCLPWGVARLLFPDRIPDQKPGIRVSAKKHKKNSARICSLPALERSDSRCHSAHAFPPPLPKAVSIANSRIPSQSLPISAKTLTAH